jgi:hypothetical protein
MKRFVPHLTYANVVATLALFLVLSGGAAYAASRLAKNSVGSAQLKKNAVTPAKLSQASKATLSGTTGPKGSTGPEGPSGPQGVPGKEGSAGRNLTAETPLASGQTETGVFGAAGTGEGSYLLGVATFVQPLAVGLDEFHVFALGEEETNAHCPGAGIAAAGYFCAYSGEEENAYLVSGPQNPGDGSEGTGKDGTQFFYSGDGSGVAYAYGTWAVTAP